MLKSQKLESGTQAGGDKQKGGSLTKSESDSARLIKRRAQKNKGLGKIYMVAGGGAGRSTWEKKGNQKEGCN